MHLQTQNLKVVLFFPTCLYLALLFPLRQTSAPTSAPTSAFLVGSNAPLAGKEQFGMSVLVDDRSSGPSQLPTEKGNTLGEKTYWK